MRRSSYLPNDVWILDRRKNLGQLVLPVFYGIDPSKYVSKRESWDGIG